MKKTVFLVILIIALVFLAIFVIYVFRGDILLKPILLTIGNIEIHWYGLLIASGIVIAYLIGRKLAFREGIDEEYILEAVFLGVILGVICARLYYVAFTWDYYSQHLNEIFMTWNGGLAIHGGIIGGIFAAFLYTKYRKKANLKFLQATDLFIVVLPLAQAIGRWGNFTNYEAYGSPTNLPWKMFIPTLYRMPGYSEFEFFHPTFLYESVLDTLIFIFLLTWILKKRKKYGEITGIYLILYSIGRFLIEGLRLDSLYINNKFRTAQVISIVFLILGIVILFVCKKFGKTVHIASEEEKTKLKEKMKNK
jgi:phosphatidylglycerol:prolipoprotein diacylglycerol transferase